MLFVLDKELSIFLGKRGPAGISSDSAAAFLIFLAREKKVAVSSQNQAFNSLLFLFQKVLDRPFEPKNVKRVKADAMFR